MGLFDKKYCDICGEKIGLLGNRKLNDGNLCKNCARLLSEWFSERRQSTVEDIRRQLAYRENNRSAVAAFRVTREYGRGFKKLFIDETSGKFTVTSDANMQNGNPDILDFSQITRVIQDSHRNQTEMKYRNNRGEMVSFAPPRYEYSYDFYIEIQVEHPFIERIRFQLNSSSIRVRQASPSFKPGAGMHQEPQPFGPNKGMRREPQPFGPNKGMHHDPQPFGQGGGIFHESRSFVSDYGSEEYNEMCILSDEIKEYLNAALLNSIESGKNYNNVAYDNMNVASSTYNGYNTTYDNVNSEDNINVVTYENVSSNHTTEAADSFWFCPYCGKKNEGAGKFCMFCGSQKP